MRNSFRATFRWAVVGCLGIAGLLSAANSLSAAEPEKSLPDTTLLYLKVPNATALRESLGQTQFAQLVADPAMKDLKENVKGRMADVDKGVKARIGVTIGELLSLPQGAISIAIVGRNDPKLPVAFLISADAGKNNATMTEVMEKSTKQAEEAGIKVSTESHKGLTLHILQSKGENADRPNPPIVWTSSGSVYHISTDIDALKDVINNAEGRSDSLASSESFQKTSSKVGESQFLWYLDISRILKLVMKVAGQNAGGDQANIEGILQVLGVNGLKSVGGGLNFAKGQYDVESKTFILAPAPVQGLLKIFSMPVANLRPESWVPATVSNYSSMSWDLDAAFTAINDLINKFQPGVLNVIEQQLVGPNGGDPLSFQKDVFGPLGDRITILSDFKKPVKEDSQRMLFGIALEDAKGFQNTLSKIFAITNASPKKREFQGSTIYDFELPEMPNQVNSPFKGAVSLTIAKDYLFLSSEPGLLEQVLRGGGQSLADSPAFQETLKTTPSQTSTLSYARSDEQARVTYEMLRSGQFEKALQQAGAGNADIKVGEIFDPKKLPDFSVFAKYLTQTGGFGVSSDDGVLFTSFSLRKNNP